MRRILVLLSIITALMLSGCASGIVKKAPPSAPSESLGENALVFGSLKWIENNEGKKRAISLGILRAEDMEKGTIIVERDGTFFALLPRGTYVIHQLDWRDPWDGPHWLVPKIAFQIADSNRVYYLGTLVVDITAKRDIIGGLWVKGCKIHIEDEEDVLIETLRTRYPERDIKVAKALMVYDPSIPHIDKLERQRVLLDVLRSLYFGIMPTISP